MSRTMPIHAVVPDSRFDPPESRRLYGGLIWSNARRCWVGRCSFESILRWPLRGPLRDAIKRRHPQQFIF